MPSVELTRKPAPPPAAPPVAAVAVRQVAVTLDRVTFERGGKRLLDDLTLSLTRGGITALMGPNGAGKSLALRLLAGLITPTQGRVVWDGDSPIPARDVALVFQKPVLFRRTVRANLDHALSIYGVPRRLRSARVDELLEIGQLGGLADRPARVLSGGEQQRVAMVRALAARPRILLLDEPSASLDPPATAAIEGLVRGAAADGVKVVLVTHESGQARRLADDVVFLHRGRVVECGPSPAFFDRPQSAEARAYLAGLLLV